MDISDKKLINRKGTKTMSKKKAIKKATGESPAVIKPDIVERKTEVTKEIEKDILFRNFNPKNEGKSEPMLLSLVVKVLKKSVLATTGGKRTLTSEGRKSRATIALTTAMLRRNWIEGSQGIYTLNSVTVDTNTPDFAVKVKDKGKEYSLTLGKGAIIELDSFMKLR